MRILLLVALFCLLVIQPFPGVAGAQVIEDPISTSPVSDPISNPIGEPSYLIWGWDTRNQALIDAFGTAGAEARGTVAWYLNAATGQLTQAAPNQPIFESTDGRIGLSILPPRTNLWTYSDPTSLDQFATYQNVILAPHAWSFGTLVNALFIDNTWGVSNALKAISIDTMGVYAFSAYVEMEDGGVPQPSYGASCGSTGDFCLFAAGDVLSPQPTVEWVIGNIYRVSGSVYIDFTGNLTFGVFKAAGQSSRKFWISGFQLEITPAEPDSPGVPSNYISTAAAPVTVGSSQTTWPISALSETLPAGDKEMSIAVFFAPKFNFQEMLADYPANLLDFSGGDDIGVIKPVLYIDSFAPVPRAVFSDYDGNYSYADMSITKGQKMGIFAQTLNSQKRAGYILPGQSTITWGEWGVHSYVRTGQKIRVCPLAYSPLSLFWVGVYNKKLDDAELLKNWN